MLYLVAIAFCLQSTPVEQCDYVSPDEFVRFWFYRQSVEECVDFAKSMIVSGGYDMTDRYAKVYCLKAEPFQNAETVLLNAW